MSGNNKHFIPSHSPVIPAKLVPDPDRGAGIQTIAFVGLLLLGAGCVKTQSAPPTNPSAVTKPKMTLATYYMVALDGSQAFTDEKEAPIFGCNDKLALVKEIAEAGSSQLEVAINRLLATTEDDEKELGLHTPFKGQDLRAEVTTVDGKTTINIIGQLTSAGVCDDPRIKNMIEETAKLYTNGILPEIRLNGSESAWRCFGDQSGQCS